MPEENESKEAFERWLPVRFLFHPSGSSVLWIDFGAEELTDPFFNRQINRLQRAGRPMRTTTIDQFLAVAKLVPPASPSGYICHVSRCGSTLLANAMKVEGRSTVFSEAQPLYQLLNRDSFLGTGLENEDVSSIRRRLLDAFFGIYAASFANPIVVKGHTIDILQIDKLRATWPEMPIAVSTRHPTEVIASNLAKPGDWVTSMLTPFGAKTLFGISSSEFRQMSVEEYAVRGLQKLYEGAYHGRDNEIHILDYVDISPTTVRGLSQRFGLEDVSADNAELKRVFSEYSKNPQRTFTSDQDRKKREITETARELIERLALPAYQRLINC